MLAPNILPSMQTFTYLHNKLLEMLSSQHFKQRLWAQLILTCVYAVVTYASSQFSNIENSISGAFFLHDGYLLALVASAGMRVWPSVLVGQLAISFFQGVPTSSALLSGLSNVMVVFALFGFFKITRFNPRLLKPKDFLLLVAGSILPYQLLSRATGLAMMMLLGQIQTIALVDMAEMLSDSLVDQSAIQVLIATNILMVIEEIRGQRSTRYWIGGLILIVGETLCLVPFIWGMVGNLNPLNVFSIIYLLVISVTFCFGLLGASISNLAAVLVIQYAADRHIGPFFALMQSQNETDSVSTLLIGIILSSALVGALMREKSFKELELIEMATRDALTGLYNRRYFFDFANQELNRIRRQKSSVVLLCLDLDHFKSINDTYGHGVGDQVLALMGKILMNTTRDTDVPARLGGEEFCVLACYTEAGTVLAERIRTTIRTALDANPKLVRFTTSIGMTLLDPADEDITVAIKRADEALYEAKKRGRDCVVVNQKDSGMDGRIN